MKVSLEILVGLPYQISSILKEHFGGLTLILLTWKIG